MQTAQLFINGAWRQSKQTLTGISPSNTQPFSTIFTAGESEVEEAICAAKAAFPAWRALGLAERSRLLEHAANILGGLEDNGRFPADLKALINVETGKLTVEAEGEIIETSDMMRYLAKVALTQLQEEPVPLNENLWPTKRSHVVPTPFGVVGVIKPWNFPLQVPLWSIVAALLGGNTVVFKPSELSSVTGNWIARMFEQAGFPSGVFNVVNGDHKVGKQLVSHPDVPLVSFTGSLRAGLDIAARCAQTLKRYVLELGGNDVAIVCKDANLETAANGIVWGALFNAGQVCTGVKRVLVVKSVYEEFFAKVKNKFSTVRLGTDVGPLVSETQLLTIERQVKETISQGAKLVAGGKRANRPGFYFEPTLLMDVPKTSTIFNEECFGPVLPMIQVADEAEAIRINNSSEYGLGASVWTENEKTAIEIASQLETGMVWHNDVSASFPEAPWIGIKYSGQGIASSKWSLEEYVYRKHVCLEKSADTSHAWWFPYRGVD